MIAIKSIHDKKKHGSDFAQYYKDTTVDAAIDYFQDILAILQTQHTEAVSPNQFSLYINEEEFIIAYSPKEKLNQDFLIAKHTGEEQAAYSLALMLLSYITEDSTNKLAKQFSKLDDIFAEFQITRSGFEGTKMLTKFYKLFKSKHIPSIQSFSSSMIASILQNSLTETQLGQLISKKESSVKEKSKKKQSKTEEESKEEEKEETKKGKKHVSSIIDPKLITKSDLPEYIKQILLKVKKEWENDNYRKLSFNRLIFYSKGSSQILEIDYQQKYISSIVDGLTIDYDKEIEISEKNWTQIENKDKKSVIIFQIGVIMLYILIQCDISKMNKYFCKRSDARSLINLLTHKKLFTNTLSEVEGNNRDVLSDYFKEICFLEGIFYKEQENLNHEQSIKGMYNVDELLNHVYLTNAYISAIIIIYLTETKHLSDHAAIDNKICSIIFVAQGGMAKLFLHFRPRVYKGKWLPYYVHKVPHDGENIVRYAKSEIIYNRLLEGCVNIDNCSYSLSFNGVPEDNSFFMPFFSGISLQLYVSHYRILTDAEARILFFQFANSLSKFYEATKDKPHRDISPNNYLIRKDKNNEIHGTLIDFGVAVDEISDLGDIRTKLGTEGFTAPEVASLNYNSRVDIFSFGMTLAYCLLGSIIEFKSDEKDNKFYCLYSDENTKISLEAASFIEKCLMHDPNHRFQNVNEMLKHSFLQQSNKYLSHVYINNKMKFSTSSTTIKLDGEKGYASYANIMNKLSS